MNSVRTIFCSDPRRRVLNVFRMRNLERKKITNELAESVNLHRAKNYRDLHPAISKSLCGAFTLPSFGRFGILKSIKNRENKKT